MVATEQRRKLRIEAPYPVTVRGVDANGEQWEENTVLDNLSSGGLYMRMLRAVSPGTSLFLIVLFTQGFSRDGARQIGEDNVDVARVAVRGEARRVALYPDGRCGVAVVFRNYRFL